MKSTVQLYFTVARILSLVVGILFCITVIGAIIGVPLIIASNKFKEASVMTDAELVKNRGSLLGWGIFVAIVFSPTFLGLIVLLLFAILVDNYIKNIELGQTAKNEATFVEVVESGANTAWNEVKNTFSGKKTNIDKQREELEKLDKMREEGLITREEYEAMRKKILDI